MINIFKLPLISQFKKYNLTYKNSGFTLIELLVAMVLAALVITPLMSFMTQILNSDRQEQAKSTSAQEIQSALDYIAQDLEQAIYIYDATGLDNNLNTNAGATSGIKDQIPPASGTNCVNNSSGSSCIPVLVFWKREPVEKIIPVTSTNCTTTPSGCDDTFVYSLVAYYLVRGNDADNTWSNTARIARFQIKNGVVNPTTPTTTTNGITTPNYLQAPSEGFNLFDLSLPGNTLKDKMNRWGKASADYTDQAHVLLDFIDQGTTGISVNCPTDQQVPSTLVGGFYACVDSSKTSAQIFIRGNALARIQQGGTYSASQSTYFPTASIQVKGRSSLEAN